MNKWLSENVLRTRLDAEIRGLVNGKPMIESSLGAIHATCGNPNCRSAKGEKHISHILTGKVNKKTKSIYVPTDIASAMHRICSSPDFPEQCTPRWQINKQSRCKHTRYCGFRPQGGRPAISLMDPDFG